MTLKSNYIKNNSLPCGLHVALSVSLAVLFTFFFVFAQAFDGESTYFDNVRASKDATVLSSDHSVLDQNHPFQSPVHSVSILPETELKNERKVNDHAGEDAVALFASLFLSERFYHTSRNCLFQQLLHSCENRSEVSLLVLHHSWKSYLS